MWEQVLMYLVIGIVGLVFTIITAYLLPALSKWIAGKIKNEAIQAALNEAGTVATQVVSNLGVNIIDGLKSLNATTQPPTTDQITNIIIPAFDAFSSDLSAGAMNVLKDNADNIQAYVTNLLKSKL